MDGQGNLMQRFPSTPFPIISFPLSSTNIGCTPGKGSVAKLGFVFVIPAIGEIIIPPVSVCHQVSTIGQLCLPICSSYQCQASSLIGSPTLPNTRRDVSLYGVTYCKPAASNARIAVGAV